jgi:hypothetical protein
MEDVGGDWVMGGWILGMEWEVRWEVLCIIESKEE